MFLIRAKAISYKCWLFYINDEPPAKILSPHTSVVDTGGKFAAGINDTGGNLPPVSTTPAANLPPVSMTPVANNGKNIRLLRP